MITLIRHIALVLILGFIYSNARTDGTQIRGANLVAFLHVAALTDQAIRRTEVIEQQLAMRAESYLQSINRFDRVSGLSLDTLRSILPSSPQVLLQREMLQSAPSLPAFDEQFAPGSFATDLREAVLLNIASSLQDNTHAARASQRGGKP